MDLKVGGGGGWGGMEHLRSRMAKTIIFLPW